MLLSIALNDVFLGPKEKVRKVLVDSDALKDIFLLVFIKFSSYLFYLSCHGHGCQNCFTKYYNSTN